MALTKEEVDEELEKVNKELEALIDKLIKALQDIGIEFIDLYSYINLCDQLTTRKAKLVTLQTIHIK